MENNDLDKAVKDKLQHLEIEYQADTWDMLEQKLAVAEDATQLEDTALDGIVFSALNEYEVPYDEKDWASMSQLMDDTLIDTTVLGALQNIEAPYQESSWDMMSQLLDDTLIDTTVIGALQDIEAPYQESNWEMMSQRLDDEAVDATVFEALNDLGVAYNDKHWAMMSQRLDMIFARPFQIIRYKLAELAFLLLLFYGVGEFVLVEKPTLDTPIADHKVENTNSKSSDHAASQYTISEPNVATNNPAVTSSSDNELDNAKQTNSNTASAKSTTKKTANTPKTITQKESLTTNELSTVPASIALPAKEAETQETSKINLQTDKNPIVISEDEPTRATKNNILANNADPSTIIESLEQKATDILTPVSLLDSDIPFLTRSKDEDLSNLSLLKIAHKKKAQLRVGMFASANMDYIFTPYDPILGLESYSRYAPGYGGGISIAWKYKRWEIETSVAYMSKRYKNRPFVHIYGGSVIEGYQANALTGIELNNVNIPLHFNYHIINSGKWRVYGLTGGTMQIVLQANYDANREDLGGGQGPTFSGGSKVSEDNSKSLFNRKNFNDGFLADKNLKENSYYSIDIGMGLERYISPYWNVFIQPTYQYNLPDAINTKGLGPNNDNINSLLFFIGIKSNLK